MSEERGRRLENTLFDQAFSIGVRVPKPKAKAPRRPVKRDEEGRVIRWDAAIDAHIEEVTDDADSPYHLGIWNYGVCECKGSWAIIGRGADDPNTKDCLIQWAKQWLYYDRWDSEGDPVLSLINSIKAFLKHNEFEGQNLSIDEAAERYPQAVRRFYNRNIQDEPIGVYPWEATRVFHNGQYTDEWTVEHENKRDIWGVIPTLNETFQTKEEAERRADELNNELNVE
jgi:hypothetical protein